MMNDMWNTNKSLYIITTLYKDYEFLLLEKIISWKRKTKKHLFKDVF